MFTQIIEYILNSVFGFKWVMIHMNDEHPHIDDFGFKLFGKYFTYYKWNNIFIITPPSDVTNEWILDYTKVKLAVDNGGFVEKPTTLRELYFELKDSDMVYKFFDILKWLGRFQWGVLYLEPTEEIFEVYGYDNAVCINWFGFKIYMTLGQYGHVYFGKSYL